MIASAPSSLPIIRRRRWICAIAVREILFLQNLVHRLALQHRIRAVLHQICDQQIRNSFADVHIASKNRSRICHDRGVIEIQNGHALLSRSRRLRGYGELAPLALLARFCASVPAARKAHMASMIPSNLLVVIFIAGSPIRGFHPNFLCRCSAAQ